MSTLCPVRVLFGRWWTDSKVHKRDWSSQGVHSPVDGVVFHVRGGVRLQLWDCNLMLDQLRFFFLCLGS